ncbi:MAG TPA: hypothetical protein VGZ73_31610 [Bryobacteraceae bacterium]|jgi:hypothetical protein|nr:hypothetical protein [Bryobacteraceae bacterium]
MFSADLDGDRKVRGIGAAIQRNPIVRLTLLTFLAVLTLGYHLGVDDAEIYVPAIKRAADPSLYPYDSEFFMAHAHLSLFSNLVGDSAHLTRLPVNLVIFVWYVFGIFLLLFASWRLLCACFANEQARWSGVVLVMCFLSVPVAGTALVIMDPYMTARSLSTPATILAIAYYVSSRPKSAIFWLLLTALIHPQMAVYGVVFLGCMEVARRLREAADPVPLFGLLCLTGVPFLFEFQPARGAAREALLSRTYFFVSNWTWYEWVGIAAPLALLWWFSSVRPRGTTPAFGPLARTLVPFGLLFAAAGVALAIPVRLENYTRLQPMRAFHLLYVVFFVLVGGLIGEYALKSSAWRWLGLFVPLVTSMWLLQQSEFPSSSHIEWPGAGYRENWTSAFLWVRDHTPKDAVFALDPNYMLRRGEDEHGFRAIAERSALADNIKDSGAVSLFPQLADHWKQQVEAQSGWEHFQRSDFDGLAKHYAVTWIVTQRPGPVGLTCPYINNELAVCRMN